MKKKGEIHFVVFFTTNYNGYEPRERRAGLYAQDESEAANKVASQFSECENFNLLSVEAIKKNVFRANIEAVCNNFIL